MAYKKSVFRNMTMVSQIGLSVMVPIFMCIAVGVFLDKYLNTNLTLILMLLGFLTGGSSGYQLVKHLILAESQDESMDLTDTRETVIENAGTGDDKEEMDWILDDLNWNLKELDQDLGGRKDGERY